MSALSEIEEAVPALRRYAWSLLRHSQDADDLVHDCVVKALDGLPKRAVDGAVKPWLFTIMHNLFVSRWRTARRRATVMVAATDAEAPVAAAQEWSLATRDLVGGLDRLPPEQRDVLLLVSVEGLEYREVAMVLGVPIGTVMSRLSRARDALRNHLEGQERQPLRRVK
ncbi:MAG: sigma-70 family RNA polymerase sigma factor [Acetobacteraceae bacterium]